MPFERVYGTETTEEYRPTYMQTQANAEPISKSILIGVKFVITLIVKIVENVVVFIVINP